MAKIETQADLDAWRIICRSKKADPDAEMHPAHGMDWARVRALICPICGAAFYGWQCISHPLAPTQRDYADGTGMRLTCGDPLCHESESEYQNRKVQQRYQEKTAGQMPQNPKGSIL